MINQQTSQRLLQRLSFTLGQLSPEQIHILEFKWGGHDGQFHSTKSVINKMKLQMNADEIRGLEERAIGIIENELNRVFQCPHCGVDLRKCGVHKTTTGYQKSTIFISSEGVPTRSNNATFHKENYPTKRSNGYRCGNCDNHMDNDCSAIMFMENHVRQDTILTYMMRFRGVPEALVMDVKRFEMSDLIPDFDG